MKEGVSKYSTLKKLKWLNSYIKPYKAWIVISLLTSFILVAINILKVYYLKLLINSALERQLQGMEYLIIILIAIVIIGALSIFVREYSNGRFSFLSTLDLKNKLAIHISTLPISTIDKRNSGEIVSLYSNEIVDLQNFMNNDFPNYLFQPLMFIGAFIYMLFINYKLLIVSMIWVPIAMYITSKISLRIKNLQNAKYEATGESNSIINDAIVGIGMVKIFNLSGYLHKKFNYTLDKKIRAELLGNKIFFVGMLPFFVICNFLPNIVCILFGGYLTLIGQMDVGSLIAFIQLLDFVTQPLKSVSSLLQSFQKNMASTERLMAIMDDDEERKNGKDIDIMDGNNAIEFINVTFGYEENKNILRNISFNLEKGKKLALVGSSGCGKSTIINLICSFYDIKYGTIKLFGKDIKGLNLKAIRKQISLVSQEVHLFPGTVAENICCGFKDMKMEQIIEAAKLANAHEFIMDMPNGYDSMVGENGTKLSGGQKQRIAIARAFIKNSPILLLDESTSALDTQSEAMIQEVFETPMDGKAVVIVAHRLSTIKQADEILVLNEGEIDEVGTHEQLIARNGLYSKLYHTQFLDSKNILV